MYQNILRASERPYYQPHNLTDEDRAYSRMRLLRRAANGKILALDPDFGGKVGAALAAKRVAPGRKVPRMSVGPASRKRSTAVSRLPSPPPANPAPRTYLRSAPPSQVPKPIIVLDGANIAYEYGRAVRGGDVFDSRGLSLARCYFRKAGFDIRVVLNVGRIEDGDGLIKDMEKRGELVRAPFDQCDDEYALLLSSERGCKIVSNDLYRQYEQYRFHLEKNLIQFTFDNNQFLPVAMEKRRHYGTGTRTSSRYN